MVYLFSIDLPKNAKIAVKKDQNIDFKTLLAKIKFEQEVQVNLSKILNISPKKIFMSLKRMVGENTQQGEILAEKKTFFEKKQYRSEISGTIKEIDHFTGNVTIAIRSKDDENIHSFLKGTVTASGSGNIKVELPKGQKFEAEEISENFGGEAIHLTDKSAQTVDEKQVINKVVIFDKISSYNQAKLEALQVAGFLTTETLPNTPSVPYAKIKFKSPALPYVAADKKNNIIYFYK
jgi:hypothetical protein